MYKGNDVADSADEIWFSVLIYEQASHLAIF